MKISAALAAIVVLTAVLLPGDVHAQALPDTAVCNHCYSDASFAHRAEQASLAGNPFMQGLDFVYVANFVSEEVRHFEVERWFDQSQIPYSSDEQHLAFDYGPARAQASETPGDSDVLFAIGNAITAVKAFASHHLNDVPADDLGLPFDSAVALIGPEDSPAGLNRNALRNQLHQHLNSNWSLVTMALSDLAQRVASRLLSDSDITFLSNLTIVFPDGTRIQVSVTEILDSLDGDIGFELEVRLESASGPGLQAVPQLPGQFAGFHYSGNSLTLAELVQLAQLYGIPITDGSGGGGGPSMDCEIEGGEIRCTVRYSGH